MGPLMAMTSLFNSNDKDNESLEKVSLKTGNGIRFKVIIKKTFAITRFPSFLLLLDDQEGVGSWDSCFCQSFFMVSDILARASAPPRASPFLLIACRLKEGFSGTRDV